MEMTEIKSLLEKQGEAWSAFKDTMETEIKGIKQKDPIVEEKLSKIEAALDRAVEEKAKIEASLEAERKEREAFEARFNRNNLGTNSEKQAQTEIELKQHNSLLGSLAAERKRVFSESSVEEYNGYKAAQSHFLRYGKEDLSPEEVKTLSVGSDPDGGYFVTPDVTGRIVKKVYESSPIRQIASQLTISTDKLQGIEDLDEAGVGYAGEKSQSGNTKTPDVGKWEIPVYWIDTEPKTTQQLLDDSAINIEAWLSEKVSQKFARFENAEFVAGNSGKIRGLTSYTTVADSGSGVDWGKIGHITSGVNGAFASSDPADKLIDLMGILKNEYLTNARWLTRRSIITLIRKFKDGQGNYLWVPSFTLGTPETIMGFPVTRAEDMPAPASGSLSLAFGDFARAYQIVDRQGMRVLRDHFTSKPYVKFYTTKRTGGAVINFEAFKLMKFSAS